MASMLAGCASAISGHGTASVPPSTSTPPPPPSSSSSTPAQPASVYRTPQKTPLGDVETADFCSGIDLSGYRSMGQLEFHPYQIAGGCFIDLLRGSDTVMPVDVIAVGDLVSGYGSNQPSDLLEDSDSTKIIKTGYLQAKWADDGKVCRRALGIEGNAPVDGVAVLITEEQLRGTSTATQRCAAADETLKQISNLYQHQLPRRSLASKSVTRFDLCGALAKGGTNLSSFGEPTEDPEAAACELSSPEFNIVVRPAFIDESFETHSNVVTVSGHRMDEESSSQGSTKGCDVVSDQGYAGHGVREVIDLVITSTTASKTLACSQGAAALVDILRATGLK